MFRLLPQPEPVPVTIDGRSHLAQRGETVASLLLRLGQAAVRRSPVSGAFRGPYCMMGVCYECLIEVDGRPAQACMARVAEGMEIRTRISP
jgi:D-hydroxyproline dehydrogenase subunit gamma